MRFACTLVLATCSSSLALTLTPTARPSPVIVPRSSSTRMLLGFGEDDGKKKKKSGDASFPSLPEVSLPSLPSLPNTEGLVTPGNLFAVAVLGAGPALALAFIASIVIVAPGKKLPFDFLDPFYPPRVAEVKMIK